MDEHLDEHGARLKHVESFAAPVSPRTPFESALLRLLLLQARDGRDGLRDGRRAAMLAALDGRANWTTLRAWRRGETRAPQWAVDLINAKILARRRVLDDSLA